MKFLTWFTDCQTDFIEPDGKLSVLDAHLIKPSLKELKEISNKYDIIKIYTADWHNDKTEEISDNPNFVTTFPKHCEMNTDGAKIVNEISPFPDFSLKLHWDNITDFNKITHIKYKNIVITKDEFDIFSNKQADEVLKLLNPTDILIAGCAANVCVDYAVMGLLKRGYTVWVVIDAIKELPNIPIEPVIKKWIDAGAKFVQVNSIMPDYAKQLNSVVVSTYKFGIPCVEELITEFSLGSLS